VFEDNGQLYISWKAYGLDQRPIEILGSRLSDDGLRLEGDPFTMLRDDERMGMEGQYHFKRGDYWYIVYAARGCCGPRSDYEVWVARSRNVAGPYEKYKGNPILWGGAGDFKSCGHGTGVETPDGRIFFMCHSYLPGNGFYMGRQPILQEMKVNDAGWVEFVGGRTALVRQTAPSPGTIQQPLTTFVDEFDKSRLRVDWTWNYTSSDVRATTKKGNLILSGKPDKRNNYGSVLCLRAQSPDYYYETTLAGWSESVQGLTMYGDERNLVIFGVRSNMVFIKMVDDGRETTLYETTLNMDTSRPPSLQIRVRDGCVLSFSYGVDGSGDPMGIHLLDDEPLDRSKLVRWDRVARPGVIHIGDENAPAGFSVFRMVHTGDQAT
jgi:beta-xylosidase